MPESGGSSAEAAYAAVTARLLEDPEVEEGRIFHSDGLKAGGRIFAMLVRDELVVKLPAERCRALAESGAGRPFESGARRMREWVTITGEPDPDTWLALAEEALAFNRGRGG